MNPVLTPDRFDDYPADDLRECPFPLYAALRDQAPVYRLPDGTWLVSRWQDVAHVVRNPEIFSNRMGLLSDQILGGPRVGGDESGPWSIPFTDGEQHRRQRSFASAIVTKRRLAWYEPMIVGLVDSLIDEFTDAREIEFRTAFAEPLPRRVMMGTFGFPLSDEPDITRWTTGPGVGSKTKKFGVKAVSAEAQAAELSIRLELVAYFEREIRRRCDQPADEFLSEMVATQRERDGELDVPYLVAETIGLFSGGFLTTAHMLASTMLLLLTHPEELRRVLEDRARIPKVLEESIRLESPVQFMQRVTTEDTTLADVPIPAESVLLVMWGSANRDEAKFEGPDEFCPGRSGLMRDHVGFGAGSHTCLGAPLARLEGVIAFNRLLDRLPNLRLAPGKNDAITHVLRSLNQRAPNAVHIAFG